MLGKGHRGVYKSPTEEESDWLTGERKIKFIDLRVERWKVVGFRKGRKGKKFHKLHVVGMNDDLCNRVRQF